jgi:hypothetical protein
VSELFDRISSERDSLERLLLRIPGFEGYLDRKARRSADRMIREHVSGLVEQQVQRWIRLQKHVSETEGGLSHMRAMDSVRVNLQTYHDRIATAAAKYSGFFEAIKVDDADLERIYAFDEAQLRYADKIAEAIGQAETTVQSEPSTLEAAISSVLDVGIEANDAFSLRDDVLLQLGEAK